MKAKIVAIYIGLTAITWVVFGQTLMFDFVNYDDQNYVYENTKITGGISIANIGWAFTHVHSENWHPLTTISHMLDCQLYGLQAGKHHFTNVLLHTAAVLLLFAVLRQTTDALWRSAFAAAVFAIHPLHVESVAWIAERKDVLSAVFLMLTLAAYAGYVRQPSVKGYARVALLFALGLLSKPMLVTVPILLCLFDYWPLRRFEKISSPTKRQRVASRLFVEKLPLFALSAASCAATFWAQRQALGWRTELPISWRINNAFVSAVTYVWQVIWPAKLTVFYPHPENRLPSWEIILAIILLTAVTVMGVVGRKKHPYIFTGWFWYLVTLIPVIGIVQVGWQGHADRYTYLPHIGLYICATWGVTALLASWRYQRSILIGVAALVLSALGCAAFVQTSYWRNSETLWTHALAVSEQNDVAENNLGILLLGRGQLDDAIARFETAVRLRPENAPAQQNLARALLQKGQPEAAIKHYQKYLEIEPNQPETRNALGAILLKTGHLKEALEQWQRSLADDPQNGNARNNLAWVFATHPEESFRNGAKAVELAEQALRLPGGKNPIVFRTLAAAYAEAGRFSEAIQTVESGIEVATSQGNSGLVQELENNLSLYRSGTPLRDPSLTSRALSQ